MPFESGQLRNAIEQNLFELMQLTFQCGDFASCLCTHKPLLSCLQCLALGLRVEFGGSSFSFVQTILQIGDIAKEQDQVRFIFRVGITHLTRLYDPILVCQ